MTTPLHAAHNANHHDDLEVDDMVVSGNTTLAGTLDVTGDATFSGDIITGTSSTYSTSGTHFNSKLRIGNLGLTGSWAGIAHKDNATGTNYALAQATGGHIKLNTSTAGYLSFRQNDVTVGDYDDTSNEKWTFHKPVNVTGALNVTGDATFAATQFGDKNGNIILEAYEKISTSTSDGNSPDSHRIKLMEDSGFGGYMSFSGLDNGDGQILPNNYMEIGIITGSNEASAIRITHTSNTPGTGSIEMFKPLAVTGNATVGGTLTVTDAATLTGGEVVTKLALLNAVNNVTNDTDDTNSGTLVIKKLLLTGTFPASATSLGIRYEEHGLNGNKRIVGSSLWIATTGGWKTSGFHNYDIEFVPGGNLTLGCRNDDQTDDRGKAFLLYLDYY